MLEGLWEAVHLITSCTTQALSQYYAYRHEAYDFSPEPEPPPLPPTMEDNDVEMRDISDDIAEACKDPGWKKPTSRSSSRSNSRKRSAGTNAKAEKRVARAEGAAAPPKVPSKKKKSPGPPAIPDVASAPGGEPAINRPLKVKRRNASDAEDVSYFMVSDLRDATGERYQMPRHVVVCAKDLASAQGYIRNYLDSNGIGGTNTMVPNTTDPIMDFASTTWLEPYGGEAWFVGDEIGLSTDTDDDAGQALTFYGAYGFDTPIKMQQVRCLASTIFILAENESHARALADKTLQSMGSTNPVYEIALIDRVAGAMIAFPPNLAL